MTVAVAAETRISHSVARVSAAPAAVPRSLSRHVRDTGDSGLKRQRTSVPKHCHRQKDPLLGQSGETAD